MRKLEVARVNYGTSPRGGSAKLAALLLAALAFTHSHALAQNPKPTAETVTTADGVKLKGLLRIVDGAREWWPYQVDVQRLRKEGPDAIARDFMKQYAQQRVPRVLARAGVQRATWHWWDLCVDECYAVLPGEGALQQFAPGLDLAALKADLAAVTG